jgi:hypothetical protein
VVRLCGLVVSFLATDPEVRVWFPALPGFLRSSGSGTGSTQPREYNWPPLWSSRQSSWLQIQRSGFDSRRYQVFWEVVGLEHGSLNLVTTTEELFGTNSNGSGLESREYGRRNPSSWPRDTLYQQKLSLTRVHVELTNLPPSMSRSSRQFGILNISQRYRPARPVTGIALLYFLLLLLRVESMKLLVMSFPSPPDP